MGYNRKKMNLSGLKVRTADEVYNKKSKRYSSNVYGTVYRTFPHVVMKRNSEGKNPRVLCSFSSLPKVRQNEIFSFFRTNKGRTVAMLVDEGRATRNNSKKQSGKVTSGRRFKFKKSPW